MGVLCRRRFGRKYPRQPTRTFISVRSVGDDIHEILAPEWSKTHAIILILTRQSEKLAAPRSTSTMVLGRSKKQQCLAPAK